MLLDIPYAIVSRIRSYICVKKFRSFKKICKIFYFAGEVDYHDGKLMSLGDIWVFYVFHVGYLIDF